MTSDVGTRAFLGISLSRHSCIIPATLSGTSSPNSKRFAVLRCQAARQEGKSGKEPSQGSQPKRSGGGGKGGGGRGGRGSGTQGKRRQFKASDGKMHLGSVLEPRHELKIFPGPARGEGPPLRVLPIGGFGEIGMNCMLIGVYDRYILVDAGLMFPDFQDLGMAKILPDVSFLAHWKDKIEAMIITHGHEDHIGAIPWVYPALDPSTPIFAGGFAMQLIKRRLIEYNLWDENRFHTFQMGDRFELGPFSCEPMRVTHSIPDCCGMILRSDHGNIVHTGDWKIDENPVDGDKFDREFFEAVGKEGVALLMSDSTNVLSPGRTTSEDVVQRAMIDRVLGHQGKGRVLTTQFASNLHRLCSVKKAAEASGRKVCFLGLSLTTYMEAAELEGRAPFKLKELVQPADIGNIDPNELLIVTTGSQGEPRAALSMASQNASPLLKLLPSDLLLYSARVIPGNDAKVMGMMNRISALGPEIALGRNENLHTSGHAYQGELQEMMQLVKPQHFLPVHGEYAFLCAHAQLAQDTGIKRTSVIKNGEMLGISPPRNGNSVGTMQGMQKLATVPLNLFYNDGGKGTGTREEMKLEERTKLATEGLVIAAVAVDRRPMPGESSTEEASASSSETSFEFSRLHGNVKLSSRAMWLGNGRLIPQLHAVASQSIQRLPNDATLTAVERIVEQAIKRECQAFNRRQPEVIVVAYELDSAHAGSIAAAVGKAVGASDSSKPGSHSERKLRKKNKMTKAGPGTLEPYPSELMEKRRQANPREDPFTSPDNTAYG